MAKPDKNQELLLQENRESIFQPQKKPKKSGSDSEFCLRKVEGTTTATGATDVSQRKGREGISGLNFCGTSRLAEDSLQNLRKISVSAIYILG